MITRLVGLDFPAVHPKNQGKGIATALVQSGIQEAKKLGLDIFVTAFESGVRVYKRLGFGILKDFVEDDSMYGGSGEVYYALMIFEQSRAAGVCSLLNIEIQILISMT